MAVRFRWSVNVYIIFLCVRSSSSKFHRFPFYVSSREQSLRTTSGILAQMFSTKDSFSWLPGCCCFYVLPCLVSVFLLVSQRFQFRPDLPECCQFSSITFVLLLKQFMKFLYIYIWNSNLISFPFFTHGHFFDACDAIRLINQNITRIWTGY